jgi:hypothetical protein
VGGNPSLPIPRQFPPGAVRAKEASLACGCPFVCNGDISTELPRLVLSTRAMSAPGTWRTNGTRPRLSAFGGKADMTLTSQK